MAAGPPEYTEIGALGLVLDREKAVEMEGALSNASRGSGWGVAARRGPSTVSRGVATPVTNHACEKADSGSNPSLAQGRG
jgi:hypothetical protein